MTRDATDRIMLRGWVRPTARFPKGPQIEAVTAAGAVKVYVDSADESWDQFVNACRRGANDVCVVDGFDRLGKTAIVGRQRLLDLVSKGVRVMDARTKSLADPAALARWDDARTRWNGESRSTPRQAKRRGKKGGKIKAEKFKAELNLSQDEMRTIWVEAASNEEAAERTGVSFRTLHRWFGPSGRKPGFKVTT